MKKRKALGGFLLLIGAVLALLLLLQFVYYPKHKDEIKLKKIGYRKEEIAQLTNCLPEEQLALLETREYRSEAAALVSAEGFSAEKLEDYLSYLEKIDGAYRLEAALDLVNRGIDAPYSERLVALIHHPRFLRTRLERYLNYPNEDVEKTVSAVNADRDYDYYTHTQAARTDLGTMMLVNKYYALEPSYVPNDLVSVNSTYAYAGNSCSRVALDAFIEMYRAAREDGLQLIINSSYRSYQSQQSVWTQRKDKNGEAAADDYAARAGFSEHQTGLALDLDTYRGKNRDRAYAWLAENAHRFGFILRYPEDREDLTGYRYERWHFRYVGKEAAEEIVSLRVTFEEYYALKTEK